MRIIFFTRSLPNPIADELARQGHTIYESLSISETLALAEQHPDAHIAIAADVDCERAKSVARHYPTLRLRSGATAAGIIFELQQCNDAQVQ